jgi:uncharacterized OB-fold protein
MSMTAQASETLLKTNPHVFFAAGEAIGAPGLSATRCHACGKFTPGKVRVCSHCLSRSVDSVAAGQQATLAEYSIAHVPAGGFAAPYAIGLVKTAEGMTLFAPLDGDVAKLKPGMILRFVTVPRPGGAVGFAYTAA